MYMYMYMYTYTLYMYMHVYKHGHTKRGRYCARIEIIGLGGGGQPISAYTYMYVPTSGCCGCSSIGPLATVFCFFFLNRLLIPFSPRAKKAHSKFNIRCTCRSAYNGHPWAEIILHAIDQVHAVREVIFVY